MKYEIRNKITREIAKECVGSGWGAILDELYDKMESLGEDVIVLQVKEKFGSLRFYCTASEEFYKTIRKAEDKSEITCEWCGKSGTLDDKTYWLKTLCDECKQERHSK